MVRAAGPVKPPSPVAQRLRLADGEQVVHVERLSHFADGRPVDLEFIRMHGDRPTMRADCRRLP